jgi:uncharacterized protein (DUF427 family)
MTDSPSAFSLSRSPERIQALFRGHMIAGSERAVIVRGAGDEPVVYFPREDVMMSVLNPIDFSTHGPLGQARYFTILRDGQFAERGAWTFDPTAPEAIDLAGMIAFDPAVVKIEGGPQTSDPQWRREAERMSDYIRHTDSGSGGSQADHWTPTVDEPGDDLRG